MCELRYKNKINLGFARYSRLTSQGVVHDGR